MPKPGEEPEIPDDFFNDLADESFIEDVVADDDDDEQYTRCMKEIEILSKDIEKRKQKIRESETSLSVEAKLNKIRRRSHSRSRSGSPRAKARKHRVSSGRKRSRSPSSRSKSPHGSRHSRHDERTPRDRRHRDMSPHRGRASRRSRSNSPHHRGRRSSSTHKNLSFLEELEQTFREKNMAFPEKDALLMGQNQMNPNMDANLRIPMDIGNAMPMAQPFNQPILQPPMNVMPNFSQPLAFPPQQNNVFYGVNPMSILPGGAIPQSPVNIQPFQPVSYPPVSHPQPDAPISANVQLLHQTAKKANTNNQKALIDRCEHAIKQIRAMENHVPVMKFMFNRTSVVVSNGTTKNISMRSPLQAHSTSNPLFKFTAPPNELVRNVAGIKKLPRRVKDIAQSLGIDSKFLFEKTRTKELNAQITDQIKSGELEHDIPRGEILIQTTTVPEPQIETADTGTQTAEYKCDVCFERSTRITENKKTQTNPKNCNIGIQTNEKDYREPIVELLSKMTAAQLVALKDFANIVDEPRPQNSMDMFKIRERLMDIYNLSQRDADAVRTAEENRLDDIQFIEQVRFRPSDMYTEGSSRDFDRRSGSSPRFNGNNMMEPNIFNNDRNMPPRMEDRFQRDDDSFQRLNRDGDEEMERQQYLEMERQRELELEVSQRRYEEIQRERRRLECIEQERMQNQSNMNMNNNMNFLGPSHQMQFDGDMGNFNREPDDRDMQRSNNYNNNSNNNNNRGGVNRRGRGSFRDNFRGRGGSRPSKRF